MTIVPPAGPVGPCACGFLSSIVLLGSQLGGSVGSWARGFSSSAVLLGSWLGGPVGLWAHGFLSSIVFRGVSLDVSLDVEKVIQRCI